MKPNWIVSARAEYHIERAYQWYLQRDSATAERWLSALIQTLDALCRDSEQYPLIEESGNFPIELRQATFGAGRKVSYRCIFALRPEGIVVYAVRHLAQDEIDPETWDVSDEA